MGVKKVMTVIKLLTALIVATLLTACAGEPQEFIEGKVTRTDFAKLTTQCVVGYVPEDLTEWTYALPDNAMQLQNAKMLADKTAGGTQSFNYALWLRNEMARQCVITKIVYFTNRYGNKEYAVELDGWLALQREGFVAHARDQAFATFHEIGHANGTWYEIN